jgi:hypothetical protein
MIPVVVLDEGAESDVTFSGIVSRPGLIEKKEERG